MEYWNGMAWDVLYPAGHVGHGDLIHDAVMTHKSGTGRYFNFGQANPVALLRSRPATRVLKDSVRCVGSTYGVRTITVLEET